MPAWLMVKVRKAPMAKSGISRSVMPPKTTSSAPAQSVRKPTPTEKTSRRSTVAKGRGR